MQSRIFQRSFLREERSENAERRLVEGGGKRGGQVTRCGIVEASVYVFSTLLMTGKVVV